MLESATASTTAFVRSSSEVPHKDNHSYTSLELVGKQILVRIDPRKLLASI